MNAEKIYNDACIAAERFFREETAETRYAKEKLKDDFFAHPANYSRKQMEDVFPTLYHLARIMVEAQADMDMETTDRGAISALKRVIKSAPKGRYDGIFEDAGKFCVTDGYHIIRLDKDIPSLPHYNGHFDTEKSMKDICYDRVEMPLPKGGELKAFLRSPQAKMGTPYMLWDCYAINAQYLLDILLCLRDCTGYLPVVGHSPMLFTGSNGDALLLPIRQESYERFDNLRYDVVNGRKIS